MMRLCVCAGVLVGIGLLLSARTLAATHERVVWADVTKVVPIVERRSEAPTHPMCAKPRPAPQAGLRELLAWDLTDTCRPREIETSRHYRVFYVWNGREYEHVTNTHPGAKIALRLEIGLAAADY